MEISRITAADLASLGELYKYFWDEESSMEKMLAVFERISVNSDYILLGAKDSGRLIGSVMGIICYELYGSCKPFMVVEDVVVDKEYRRGGVGSQLMRKLEECAITNDCGHILLVTGAGRLDAIEFYQSLGYQAEQYKGFKKKLASGVIGV